MGNAKPARGARTFFVIGLVELPLVMGAKGSRGAAAQLRRTLSGWNCLA